MLLITLAFYIGINFLSGKRTSSNNSSYEVKVLLSSKKRKRKVIKAKRVVMLTKQMK